MKLNNQTIYIIDDDVTICNAIRSLLELVNFNVETYNNAQSFLNNYTYTKHGCIMADVRMPGMSGLELLEHLNMQNNRLPVLIITGYGDVPMAIRAMKSGAFDFILKPFNEQCLLETIQKCMSTNIELSFEEDINKRFNSLSKRESQIINLISNGKLNKEIAYELEISMSTVEAHRDSIMRKTKAKNLAQLIKFYLKSHLNIEHIKIS